MARRPGIWVFSEAAGKSSRERSAISPLERSLEKESLVKDFSPHVTERGDKKHVCLSDAKGGMRGVINLSFCLHSLTQKKNACVIYNDV